MNSVSISQFTQNTALLRKGQFAEGIVVEGINEEDLEFIDKMVVEGSSRLLDKGVIIGKSLADLLDISLNDKITIFDLSTLYLNNKNFMQFNIEGIFHSGMTEYDKSSIFIKIEDSKSLFNLNEKISGYVIRLKKIDNYNVINKTVSSNISYPLMSMTWKEKNRALYKWLNVQRWPILFIFSLITLVAIINIISSLSMIVVDKTTQIGLLSAIGMPSSKIKNIFFIKGLIIGFLGTTLGSLIAISLATLQNNFKIIGVPEDIYFMNFIPIDINFIQILTISTMTLVITSFVSYSTSARSSKILPSQALKYE
jgi:lipoprotein-releasing system permease protein